MKIYLDDERQAPEGWSRVYTPEEVIECLKTGLVTDLSLDHNAKTGIPILLWLYKEVSTRAFKLPKLDVRSAKYP